ncbi:MAG: LuxR C-terminal-related transcriptional regulator [Burkholderia sp.]
MRDSIVKLGKVISNVGGTRFFSTMQQLIEGAVAIELMQVAIRHREPHHGWRLGTATLHGPELQERELGGLLPEAAPEPSSDQAGPRLIQLAPRQAEPGETAPVPAHRCLMLMCRAQVDFVVLVQRGAERGEFRSEELAALGNLSKALLPLVEQHASMQPLAAAEALPADDEPSPLSGRGADTLLQRFRERLDQQNITLSLREQQVCLLNLSGYTLPAICDELDLRAGTVETYLKRARLKLGLSGRHGLSRWMIE